MKETQYLPPDEILKIQPSIVDNNRKEGYKTARPGGDYALVLYEKSLVIVPPWHPLNQIPISANAVAYGTGSMETLSFEPVSTSSANLVLIRPRMKRLFERSFPAREIQFPIEMKSLEQGIIDLMSILGESVLIDEDGHTGIGSVRVTVGPGLGKFGKNTTGQGIEASVEAYAGQRSLPDRAYDGTGLIVNAGPNQRFHKFKGKHSSQYGDGGHVGAVSKRLHTDDSILFAPHYASRPDDFDFLPRYKNGSDGLTQAMLGLALADGFGAELLAVRQDGTILLPPMSVNRLGGVTADYIMHYLAPALGFSTQESLFCLQQVLDGEIIGLFYAGNAARIAAIATIKLHDANENVLMEIHLPVDNKITLLIERFENEVRGVITPSHPSLVTQIDLKRGEKVRKILDEAFTTWL